MIPIGILLSLRKSLRACVVVVSMATIIVTTFVIPGAMTSVMFTFVVGGLFAKTFLRVGTDGTDKSLMNRSLSTG